MNLDDFIREITKMLEGERDELVGLVAEDKKNLIWQGSESRNQAYRRGRLCGLCDALHLPHHYIDGQIVMCEELHVPTNTKRKDWMTENGL